jgi:threonine aldolase
MRAGVVSSTYKWQHRWVVDLDAHTATHESGLVVHFADARERVGRASAPFGAGYVDADNLAAVTAALEAKNGKHNTPIMLRRLATEAGKVWQWQEKG